MTIFALIVSVGLLDVNVLTDFAKGIKYCIKNIKKNNLLKSRNTIYNMFEEKKALKEYTNFINKII